MKKLVNICFLCTLCMLLPLSVKAEQTGYVTSSTSNLVIRTSPTSGNNSIDDGTGQNAVVLAGDTVEIIDTVDESPIVSACNSNIWYEIKYNDYNGYVCSDYITLNEDSDKTEEPSEDVTGVIATDYKVVAYATHTSEGRVAVVEPNSGSDSTGCTAYRVLIDNKIACASLSQLSNMKSVSVLDTNTISYDFETELAKFPDSYKSYLREIHAKHPTWRFYAYNTNLDWNTSVNIEKNSGLISSSNSQSYFDVYEGANYNWKTNTFIPHEAGSWYTPSKVATSYYLDPRTYLDIDNLGSDGYDYKSIFVFEDSRAYTYQTTPSINQMITYGGLSNKTITTNGITKTYTDAFTDGATFSKISALTLIARSRNETGKFTSNSVSGNYTNTDTNESFVGLYNYFNVGAYGTYPVTNGLKYAKAVGWTDQYKAIVEGSTFIGTKYVYNGQETQYFQKFNVSPSTLTSVYTHQYQTNIQAPITEAGFVFWGYKDSGNIDQPIVFHIPVYNNMPETVSVEPKSGNPNNWLTDLKINDKTVSGFDGDNYYSYDDNWDNVQDDVFDNNVYKYTLAWNEDSVEVVTETAVSTSKVSGNGIIKITEKTTELDVVVTAENGTTKTYRLVITKQDAPEIDEGGDPVYPVITDILNTIGIKYNDNYMSGLTLGTNFQVLIDAITNKNSLVKTVVNKNSNNKTNYFATGDIITVTSGSETKNYSYVLYGDLNGDGVVDLIDLVNCRNLILGQSNLTGSNKEASDVNKDSKIDLIDLVTIRNAILGQAITQ